MGDAVIRETMDIFFIAASQDLQMDSKDFLHNGSASSFILNAISIAPDSALNLMAVEFALLLLT